MCLTALPALNAEDCRLYIEFGLGVRTTMDILTWSVEKGGRVYHVGLTLLIGKIVEFPRKEKLRQSGLIGCLWL